MKYTHLGLSLFTVLLPIHAVIAEFDFKGLNEKWSRATGSLSCNSCYFSHWPKINLKEQLEKTTVWLLINGKGHLSPVRLVTVCAWHHGGNFVLLSPFGEPKCLNFHANLFHSSDQLRKPSQWSEWDLNTNHSLVYKSSPKQLDHAPSFTQFEKYFQSLFIK